jgi:hypothetical protein
MKKALLCDTLSAFTMIHRRKTGVPRLRACRQVNTDQNKVVIVRFFQRLGLDVLCNNSVDTFIVNGQGGIMHV